MAQTPDLQIEIIHPNGRRETRILAGAKKIANIGSHPANEIVLSGAGIAEFHAILDYRQTQYRYLLLNGNQAVVEESLLLAEGVVTIGGYKLNFGLAQRASSSSNHQFDTSVTIRDSNASIENDSNRNTNFDIGTNLDSRPKSLELEPKSDTNIHIEVVERTQWVSPEQTATWTLIITNTGSRTARFIVELFGLDKNLREVSINPDDEARIRIQENQFNLNNNVSQSVAIRITPPRIKELQAGWYQLRVLVWSPDYSKDKLNQASVVLALRIRTHDAFEIDKPEPTTVKLRFRGKRDNEIRLPIYNFGNRPLPLTVSGNDPARSLQIEFAQDATVIENASRQSNKPNQTNIPSQPDNKNSSAIGILQFKLPVKAKEQSNIDQEKQEIKAWAQAFQFYWFGWKPRKTELQFTVIPEDERRQQYLPVLVEHRPLIGPGFVIAAIIVSLIFVLIGFRASIYEFSPNPLKEEGYEIQEDVTLKWKSYFSFNPERVELQAFHNGKPESPVELSAEEIQRQTTIVQASKPTSYTITAYSRWGNLLSIIPSYPITATDTLTTIISAKIPTDTIQFTAPISTVPVIAGSPLNIEWTGPSNIITYVVQTDDLQQHIVLAIPFIDSRSTTGQLQDLPQKDITYTVYGLIPSLDPISATKVITVQQPNPIIEFFKVEPAVRAPGDTVTISWSITGTGVTSALLNGEQVERSEIRQTVLPPFPPTQIATFALTAVYSGTQPSRPGYASSVATVSIAPATATPTALPVKIPKINVFKAEPLTVVQKESITFTWDVDLNNSSSPSVTSEISISPIIGAIEPKDKRTVSMETPGPQSYVLKAKVVDPYSTAIATREIQINVLEPTGTPTPTPIPAAQGSLKVVATGSDQVNPLGDNRYQVNINGYVGLQWEISNKIDGKTKSEIRDLAGAVLGSGGDKGTLEVQVRRNSQYQLWATNDPAQSLQLIATVTVEVLVPPTPKPVFNVSIVITDGIGATMPAKISWFLPGESINDVAGFRIYRSDNKDANNTRTIMVDESALDKSKREWIDTNLPTCGKTYYVVVAYDTYTENGEKIRVETNASDNSVVSPPCPDE